MFPAILFHRSPLWPALMVLLGSLALPACKPTDRTIEPAPQIGFTWITPMFHELAKHGYERREYFFRGTANAYINITPLDSGGHWQVTPSGETADYKSRMVVYRPKNPDAFNGTVIVEWMNVSSGMDTPTEWIMLHTELMRRGYAYVGVSAQYVGVEGGPVPLPTPIPVCLAVKCANPLRYHSLSHPGDSFSYDIFRQAAELIRNPPEVNPLGQLQPRYLIAAGQSQSAHRLVTFINAFGKSTDLFDGYFIHSRLGAMVDLGGGASAPLSEAPQPDIVPPAIVRMRDDLAVPILNLQTESDQIPLNAQTSRQDDHAYFRLWEVAGSAHADTYVSQLGLLDKGNDPRTAAVTVSASPNPLLGRCPDNVSNAPQHHFVAKAAIHALQRWIAEGIAPPAFPRLQISADGLRFETDEHGNALGGVRSPYVDVPVAQMSGLVRNARFPEDKLCFLYGSMDMLDADTLRTLYPGHGDYVAAVSAAAQDAVTAGVLLEEDAQLVMAAAEAAQIPPP